MALFEYFPNYVWNLSVAIALESGGRIGEIVDMCAPIKAAAASGEDTGTPEFMREWVRMADKLAALAAEDETKSRRFSAGETPQSSEMGTSCSGDMTSSAVRSTSSSSVSPMPTWARIRSETSTMISGFSVRNVLAFSRPWPSCSPS